MYKSDFKDIFLELAANVQSDKAFLLISGFCPQRVVWPCPGAIYMWKNIIKCVQNQNSKRFVWNLRQMVEVIRAFLLTSKGCPRCAFCHCPGAIYMYKIIKMCIKSDFEEIILKLATYGQREKAVLLSSKFCPQGVVCPCPGATYMYKSIKIYTRTRCQMSIYRTTGPLVLLLWLYVYDTSYFTI